MPVATPFAAEIAKCPIPRPSGEGGQRPGEGSVCNRDATLGGLRVLATSGLIPRGCALPHNDGWMWRPMRAPPEVSLLVVNNRIVHILTHWVLSCLCGRPCFPIFGNHTPG